MKKHILMIGNTDGLHGIPVDMNDYYYFFLSPIGGNWCSDEVEVLMNPSQSELLDSLDEIAEAEYDFVIIIFSGHGGRVGNETMLAINGQEEMIAMSELTNLSPRQLLIIDCCRVPLQSADPAFTESEGTALSMSRDPIRQAYEERIQDSVPQQVILFACDEDEPAGDSPMGAIYAQYLLDATETALTKSSLPFITVGKAHHKAVSLMKQDPDIIQHPQIRQPLCGIHRRLPLAINPNFL
jgi:hypothetical protein